jgi:hypothetical protein
MSVETFLRLAGRDLIVQSYQDVEDIIEDNKRWKNAGKQTGPWRKTSTIPNNIILQWLNEEWERGNTTIRLFSEEFRRLVQRKLRDPDWAYLRTDK